MSNYLNSCNNVAINSVYNRRPSTLLVNTVVRFVSVTSIARIWVERRKQRRRLAELPPHLLKDIGISPVEASREAAKPFWEV